MEKAEPAKPESNAQSTTGQARAARVGRDIDFAEMAPWLELFCWSVLAWVPWLYWINGPAVTDDQAVVQAIMIITAFLGGVLLRIRAIRLKRKRRLVAGAIASAARSSNSTSDSGAQS
jgi:hypothetical protein